MGAPLTPRSESIKRKAHPRAGAPLSRRASGRQFPERPKRKFVFSVPERHLMGSTPPKEERLGVEQPGWRSPPSAASGPWRNEKGQLPLLRRKTTPCETGLDKRGCSGGGHIRSASGGHVCHGRGTSVLRNQIVGSLIFGQYSFRPVLKQLHAMTEAVVGVCCHT